jgi:hypothetical protein
VTDAPQSPDLRPPEMQRAAGLTGAEGIGGWLYLPIAHLVIDILLLLTFVAVGFLTRHTFAHAAQSVAGEVIRTLYLLATLLVAIYAAYCLIRLFQKRREVPRLMIGFYIAVLGKAVWNAAMLGSFPELQTADMTMPAALRDVLSAVVAGVVWIWYFRVSERVRNTFTR